MEIVVLEQTKKRLVFELKGADNTFCNVLKKELLADKDVAIATYAVKHPLIGIPKFIIECKGKSPKQALMDASERLTAKNKEFLQKFKRQMKK
ncbi:MAG: DNA-directed RNA polymerase subunit L [Nanoarchaeota archaeon]